MLTIFLLLSHKHYREGRWGEGRRMFQEREIWLQDLVARQQLSAFVRRARKIWHGTCALLSHFAGKINHR